MKKALLITALLIAFEASSNAGNIYSKTVFMDDISVGTNWPAVTNCAIAVSSGGTYTNGVYTNYYRISATNSLGRLPVTTNLSVAWTGATNSSNAVVLTWKRYDGIWNYVVEKSSNGTTWTNWTTRGPDYTNFYDYGTNVWTGTDFTNAFTTLMAREVDIDFSQAHSFTFGSVLDLSLYAGTGVVYSGSKFNVPSLAGISNSVDVLKSGTTAWNKVAEDFNASSNGFARKTTTNSFDEAQTIESVVIGGGIYGAQSIQTIVSGGTLTLAGDTSQSAKLEIGGGDGSHTPYGISTFWGGLHGLSTLTIGAGSVSNHIVWRGASVAGSAIDIHVSPGQTVKFNSVLTGVGTPTDTDHAVNKAYLDNGFVPTNTAYITFTTNSTKVYAGSIGGTNAFILTDGTNTWWLELP